jgi:hypothetical protein
MCFGHQLPWNVSNHSLADDLPTFFIKYDTEHGAGWILINPRRGAWGPFGIFLSAMPNETFSSSQCSAAMLGLFLPSFNCC